MTFASESADWILPSRENTFTSTIPNYEEAPPFRVNHEGAKNYVRNRGTLNIGDWAIEGRRMSATKTTAAPIPTNQETELPQPKVLGPDALRNYTKSRCTTPNLIYGNVQQSDSNHAMRVKQEGRANYEKNQDSQMKTLLYNYGKSPLPTQPVPHTQGELATNLFYSHQEGQMGPLINNYGRNSASSRPVPHVKGIDAEINLQKGQGDSQIFGHGIDRRLSTPDSHVKGNQAQLNYDMGQGRHVNELFHQYGKLQQATRTGPKVNPDGVQNLIKGQGDAMRKTLSQCPQTARHIERSQPVPSWQ